MTKLKTARDGLNRRVEDGCRVLWCKAIKESTHGAGTLTDHYKNLKWKPTPSATQQTAVKLQVTG
jgi:hypothetical protein